MAKVLIVDDNNNNRLTLNLLLEEVSGIEIYEAEDGQIAVEMCVKQNFDLIFMDIMMPNMDGFEA
ncbi:MAG: response regulator, partial [Campylobacteraceae bacterium]|nr:response regulator [Campylobacteraceae bacterium]